MSRYLPEGFDTKKAVVCASLVQWAYDRSQPAPGGVELMMDLHCGGELFGLVARHEGRVYAAWRGTATPEDWLQDVRYVQKPFLDGWAHLGFLMLYEDCSTVLRQALEGVANVIVTGHSSGAAIATDAALAMSYESLDSAYLFAAPRAVSPNLAESNPRRIFSIVNRTDLVPTVPPAVNLALFGHWLYSDVGVPVCFAKNTGTISGNHSMDLHAEFVRGLM